MTSKEIGSRFFLKAIGDATYRQVPKAEFIAAERAAGFTPKGLTSLDDDYWEIPATGGFSNTRTGTMGKVEL